MHTNKCSPFHGILVLVNFIPYTSLKNFLQSSLISALSLFIWITHVCHSVLLSSKAA